MKKLVLFVLTCSLLIGCNLSTVSDDKGVINYLSSHGIEAEYLEYGIIYVDGGNLYYSAKLKIKLPPDFIKYLPPNPAGK